MRPHHIGYAVQSIDSAQAEFAALGFQNSEVVEDISRGVSIAFAFRDGYRVELVSPLGAGSPIDAILRKSGTSAYHMCFETEDIVSKANELLQRGYVQVIAPAPAPALGGALVSFLYSKSVGLIELVEIAETENPL